MITEKKYVNDLKQLISVYIDPLLEFAETENCQISFLEFKKLKKELSAIANLNQPLANEFQIRIEKFSVDQIKISDLFLKIAEGIQAIYAPYSISYAKYFSAYLDSRKDPKVDQFFTDVNVSKMSIFTKSS